MCKTSLTVRFGYATRKHSTKSLQGWEIDRIITRRRQQSRELLDATRRLLAEARAILRAHAVRR